MAWNDFWKPRGRLALAALLWLPSLAAQSNAGYLTIGEPQRVAGKRNAALQSKISCTVQAGYHVNSNTPAEDYLIPLKLTWTATGALEPGPVIYPAPKMEKYEFSEKPLSVLTGKFDVTVNFKVAANAPAGPGIAAGKLRYQACNDRACYPPKTIDVAIQYQVQ
jgi:DsbC/DsbD-like thiol-disulfide interchange protein